MDRITPQARSSNMARIRSRGNYTTELRLKACLIRRGVVGWKVQPSEVFGQPDFVFPSLSLAVFVDGCFWHGCPRCGHLPKSNAGYWREKLKRNRRRDRRVTARLRKLGWLVLRVWEHEVRKCPRAVVERIVSAGTSRRRGRAFFRKIR